MTTETETRTSSGEAEAQRMIVAMRNQTLCGDQHWFVALLQAVGHWRLAEETVGERRFRYLIAGEAFDWLLLAERLCLELEDIVALPEREALLFQSQFPLPIDEEEFRQRLGAAKYRAHLNFLYGVQVEEALQMVVEQEVYKERRSCIWRNGQLEDEICQRLYGGPRRELLQRFAEESSLALDGSISLGDLKVFTYWLFKHRVNNCDPARVASDTRKGLAAIQRLQEQRALRRKTLGASQGAPAGNCP